MRVHVLFFAVSLIAVALSGCTGDDGASDDIEIDGGIDPEQFELKAGKGAIAGLIIDDRFRPIPGALVLLQPVGLTTTTTVNGEYHFIDLEPGEYKVRVQAEGHEAVPQTVQVKEGIFEEANVVARRVINEAGTIITREYGVFIPCGADALVVGTVTGYCPPDLSGDSFRSGYDSNLIEYGKNITFMVTEMYTEQTGGYSVVIRATGPTAFGGQYYAEADMEGNYVKVTNPYGVQNTEHEGRGNVPWMNDAPFETILFIEGAFSQELNDAYDGSATCVGTGQQLVDDRLCRGFSGVGAAAGVKAQFVQSVFIGEPEVDIENYCVLC